MGDHWKSLANKLGAPGMDAPQNASPAPSEPARPASTKPETTKQDRRSPEARTPETIRPESSKTETKKAEFKELDQVRFQPASEAPAQPRSSEPQPTKRDRARNEEVVTPPIPAVAPADATADAQKPKRKSSWDKLTSIFGLGSGSSQSPVSSSAPAETDDLHLSQPAAKTPPARSTHREPPAKAAPASWLSGDDADESPSSSRKGSALEELFGEAPRQELSWDKPAPRRIIDDVSGWDEEVASADQSRSQGLDDQADTFTPASEKIDPEDDADSEGPNRRRRRRRRGRRDRDDRSTNRPANRQVGAADTESEGALDDQWVDDLAKSDTGWSEPDDLDVLPADPSLDIDSDVDPDAPLPERRSSRRRRRGRGRSERNPEGSLPTKADLAKAELSDDATVDDAAETSNEGRAHSEERDSRRQRDGDRQRDRQRDGGRDRDRDSDRDRERPQRGPRDQDQSSDRPRRQKEPREGRGSREPREPRDLETRPERPTRRQRTKHSEPRQEDPNDIENQVDSSLAAELEGDEGSGGRHPKIPTWTDSLEAIINANIQNHQRHDSNRGGGGHRGKPRGGGSGGGSRR